jgi:tRNA threonylcarbamoyl adenosine modification protein YeaZ
VLEQIDEVLETAGRALDDVDALAVGTGPGSFTGLRVGLATIKTMAYARRLPVVGVMSSDALRLAATRAGAAAEAAVVLPAGARDHYLARPGGDPVLIAPGELARELAGTPVLTVDMDPVLLGEEAARHGRAALEGMPAALLELAGARIAAGETDDIEQLTPAYVALPRGVKRAAEDLGWSPDLR